MLQDIQDLFLNQHGTYAKLLQFETLSIIIIIILFFTYYFKNNYGFIIILIAFSLYIANTYVSVKNSSVNDFNHITLIKLQKLQQKSNSYIDSKMNVINNSNAIKLSKKELDKIYQDNTLDSLYIDANMIHFLYSIIKLSEYNEYEFFNLLKGTNNILKIKNQIYAFYEANGDYPINTSEMLQQVLELRTNTINNMHNFIYSVPKTNVMYNYINSIINRYIVLISRVTDSIHLYYLENIKKKGINTNTQFIDYNKTKPYDYDNNHSVIPNKINNINKLPRFYT